MAETQALYELKVNDIVIRFLLIDHYIDVESKRPIKIIAQKSEPPKTREKFIFM